MFTPWDNQIHRCGCFWGAHVARKCLWIGGTAVDGAWMRRRRHTYESRGLTRSQNATFRRNRIARGRRDPERRDGLFPVVALYPRFSRFFCFPLRARMRIKPRRNRRAGDCLSDKRSPRALICVTLLRVYFIRFFSSSGHSRRTRERTPTLNKFRNLVAANLDHSYLTNNFANVKDDWIEKLLFKLSWIHFFFFF